MVEGSIIHAFEDLDLWVPLVFRQGELVLSSIQRRVDSMFERMLGLLPDSSANCVAS